MVGIFADILRRQVSVFCSIIMLRWIHVLERANRLPQGHQGVGRLVPNFLSQCHDGCARSFHGTCVKLEGEEAAMAPSQEIDEKLTRKLAANEFNRRRASYKREVSHLRRKYAMEVERQRAADKAEREALERELTRRRLERQRRKNERSALNAMRQEQLREQRRQEFEEHLKQQQMIRDAQLERYTRARQMVIDELEAEAHLWLTTPEEVEAAFTPEAEQRLWARPGGILGAPNPSVDSAFWQFETHTYHMDKTYKSQRDVLLETIEDAAYQEANVNSSYWTEERIAEQTRLEEKARLRAMVYSAGRTELLKRQKLLMEEDSTVRDGELPKPKPAANLTFLRNDKAIENEGVQLLMQDPTKFFVFEGSTTTQEEPGTDASYSGPTLGTPSRLRDPLRDGDYLNQVVPQIVGKLPKPDTRTEREKKQQEREDRLWAAAQAEARSDDMDIELAANRQTAEDLQPDLNYDEVPLDPDEEEWSKGLDPVQDAHLLNVPHEYRYSEGDIDWVLEKLEGTVDHLEQQFGQDMEALKWKLEAEAREKTTSLDSKNLKEGKEEEPKSLDAVLLSLSDAELMVLSDLDDRYAEGTVSESDFAESMRLLPRLSPEDVRFILERNRSSD